MPVNADPFGIRIITKSSLNENVAQFRQEIKAFKEKNKIRYSLKTTEAAVIIQPNDEQQAEQLEKLRSMLDRQYLLKEGRAIRRFHSKTIFGEAAEILMRMFF